MISFISTTSIDLDFKYFDVPPVDKIWIPNLTNFFANTSIFCLFVTDINAVFTTGFS